MMTVGMQVVAGVGMDGVTAVVEHLDLRQEETSHWQQGQCPGTFGSMSRSIHPNVGIVGA